MFDASEIPLCIGGFGELFPITYILICVEMSSVANPVIAGIVRDEHLIPKIHEDRGICIERLGLGYGQEICAVLHFGISGTVSFDALLITKALKFSLCCIVQKVVGNLTCVVGIPVPVTAVVDRS